MIEQRVTLQVKPVHWVDGTSRYAAELAPELRALGWSVRVDHSQSPLPARLARLLRARGVDLAAFVESYPLVPVPSRGGVLHLTGQALASSLAVTRPSTPCVVTVHDVFPPSLRAGPRGAVERAFWRLTLRGLRLADAIVADSAYTADELSRAAGIDRDAIRVVPLAVDHRRFRPVPLSDDRRARLGIGIGQYVLYVGSEDPRKNLRALFEAVARVAGEHDDLTLVKAGRAHYAAARDELRALTIALGIQRRVTFLDDVTEEDLVGLYSGAAASVTPSLQEGFGLPVLEAMACGAPVVCARTTSLPEVAGEASVLVEPTVEGLAAGLRRVLSSVSVREELRRRGLERAAPFTWRRTAEATVASYREAARKRPART